MNETTTKAVLNESTLTAIAEAIRQKSSSSAALKPGEMAEAIKNIKSGGGDDVYRCFITDEWPAELAYDGGADKVAPRIRAFYHIMKISPKIIIKNAGSLIPQGCFESWSSSPNQSSQLETVEWTDAKIINEAAFQKCYSLKRLICDGLEKINSNVFNGDKALIDFGDTSNVTYIGIQAFMACTALTSLSLPAVKSLGRSAFSGCTGLTKVDIGEKFATIDGGVFYGCSHLETLILRNPSAVVKLSYVAALNNSGISSKTGYVYVPSALLSYYKTATNWVSFASQLRAIEDYPEICS